MELQRRSGILLHPTSLPGTPGIGTIGQKAFEFVDWLVAGHQSLWQILPLGPTGYGDSPYASFSTFAGNPLMIDLDDLVERGWAEQKSIVPPEYISLKGNVDFGSVVWWKMPVLKQAAIERGRGLCYNLCVVNFVIDKIYRVDFVSAPKTLCGFRTF